MELKRLYDHDAPKERWTRREDECRTCRGKGVTINETGDGIVACSGCEIRGVHYDCTNGVLVRSVPPVRAVMILRAGKAQKFSPSIVEQGGKQGWLTMADGMLTINAVAAADDDTPTAVKYRVLRTPGLYCCHCEIELADTPAAKLHVTRLHEGAESPDESNPAGYRRDNWFTCERED